MQAAAHYQSLKSFGTVTNDGQYPLAGVVVGSDGMLYGTASGGGISNAGTLFSLRPDGSGYRTIYSFPNSNGGESTPLVVEGSDGTLYGTTPSGGSNQWGTVFKLNRDGSGYGLLHTFFGYAGGDGGGPNGLVEGSDGVLYGTTLTGGSNNWGTVFRLNTDGSGYRLLLSFANTNGDGAFPYAGVVDGGDGALYGTTHDGGSTNLGMVFKLNKDGTSYSILHNFSWGSVTNLDGYNPTAPLVEASDGVLYGTTYNGGGLGKGTVFKLNRDGSGYSLLQSFGVINSGLDGLFPWGGLVEGSDGAIYGTTLYGGTDGVGTVFRFTKDGSEFETLYQLHATLNGDGQNPRAGLTKANDGVLYGTTAKGGAMGLGVVFRLLPPRHRKCSK
jgi:uncharacterized repeat protein (TIGR03803 family)